MSTSHSTGPLGLAAALALGCTLDTGGVSTSAGGSTGPAPASSTTHDSDDPADSTGSTSNGQGGSTGPVADGGSSSGSDDGEGSSSDSGEPAVWPRGPFGDPVAVGVLNMPGINDDDPSLTEDRLELYFNSNRRDSDDIFVSTRLDINDPWGPPQPVDEVNSTDHENTPEVSADGLVLMFASMLRGIPGDMDIYISYRSSRAQSWGKPQRVQSLSSDQEDLSPTLTLGMDWIYVCSQRPDTMGGTDIFRTSVTVAGSMLAFGVLEPVLELASDAHDCTVSLSPDRRVIFFDSRRMGAYDLMMATRDEPGQAFGDLQFLDELNVPGAEDGDPWISSDGHVLYFSSTRVDGAQDIFYALR